MVGMGTKTRKDMGVLKKYILSLKNVVWQSYIVKHYDYNNNI